MIKVTRGSMVFYYRSQDIADYAQLNIDSDGSSMMHAHADYILDKVEGILFDKVDGISIKDPDGSSERILDEWLNVDGH